MTPSSANDSTLTDLAGKNCAPCRGGTPPMKGRELEGLIKHFPGWSAVNEHHITRTFKFPDFRTALEFTNKVGAIAEAEGHHPDIRLSWGKVEITTWTHKIDGLTENDFILAAKINKL
jgi:4a-hydroxytetrahydrobiopterin dehydratase